MWFSSFPCDSSSKVSKMGSNIFISQNSSKILQFKDRRWNLKIHENENSFFLVWLPSKSEVKMKDVENISIFLGKSFLEFNLLGYQKWFELNHYSFETECYFSLKALKDFTQLFEKLNFPVILIKYCWYPQF